MSEVKIDLNNLDKSNWKTYRFDEIAKNISERVDPNNTDLTVYIGLEHIDSESLQIKRHGTPDDVNGTKLKFYKGDIIFGRRRAYQRKAGIATCDGFCSAHSLVLRANPDLIDPELFPFFLHSDLFMNRAIDISVGSLSPTINWGTLKHQEFLIPPKELQQNLCSLFKAGEYALGVKNKLINESDTVLTVARKKNFDFGYGISSSDLPTGWRMLKIKSFANVQAGSTPLRANKEYFDGGTIPWLKTLDLNNDFVLDTEEKITEHGLKKSSCRVKPIGTVLVAMYGGYNQIGRTGLLKIPSATNQAVSAIEVDESVILPEYLLNVLNAKVDYWKKVAISSRKDPNITKKDVEEFPVPVPPVDIQKILIDSMNEINAVKEDIVKTTDSLKLVKKTIINKVF